MIKIFLSGLADDIGAFSFIMSSLITCAGLVVSYKLGLDPDSKLIFILMPAFFLTSITIIGFLSEKNKL